MQYFLAIFIKFASSFRDQFTIVPILVGSIDPSVEALYGQILAPYLEDPQNLFVVSSDFCHWGRRFSYTYYEQACGAIHKSIEKLDKNVSDDILSLSCVFLIQFDNELQGMDIIETLNPSAFTEYLARFNNTICGRHPIGVLLQAVRALQTRGYKMSFKFLKYAQSSHCVNMADSSVSYASGSLIFEWVWFKKDKNAFTNEQKLF